MPFVRLNQNYVYDTRKFDTRSNIYMSYREEVEMLTAPSLTDIPIPNYMDCYVEMEQHKQLLPYLDAKGPDSLVYLTGVTGSGKTTLLKAVFDQENNGIVINGKTAIITFVWKPSDDEKNHPCYSVNIHYANFLLACINKISKIYGVPTYKQNVFEFLEFIENNDFDFYAQGNGEGEEKIKSLQNFDLLKFAMLYLRYMLSKCEIENVVFLFDELEEAGKDNNGEELEIVVIELAYTIKHFLSSRTIEARVNEGFRFTVMISCRHYVYRMVTNKKKQIPNRFWLKVNAESQSETMIDIPNPPPLILLLSKRKEVIMDSLTLEKDKAEFNEVFLIACEILSLCGDIILALSIGNIRDAYKYIQYLLFNKRWLQRKENINGGFSISSSREDYNLTLPSFLRALALRENTVYTHESIIPNLLDNTNGKSDLSILIVLSFFICKQNDPELRQDFGSQFDVAEEFESLIDRLFADDSDHIYKAYSFLLNERVILRSSHCCQADAADDPHLDGDPKTWKYVYLAKQASILWNLLEQNSVLFEMFVDDIKLEKCIQSKEDLKKRSFMQFNILAFQECLCYLEKLICVENDMLKNLSSRSLLKEYRENFGYSPICYHLFNGLKKSFDVYFRDRNIDKNKERMEELEKQLKKLSDTMNKLELFNPK